MKALSIGAVLLVCAPFAGPIRPDLDVGIPPGSPTSWGRHFPAITLPRGPLFPETQGGAEVQDPTRTVAHKPTAELDVHVASSFGIVRILTWDLMEYFPWIEGAPIDETKPVTGRAVREAPLPTPGEALYWTSMASMLRLLLHPQLVSEKALIAHLTEIGEPVLGVLELAASEKALRRPCRELQARIGGGRRSAGPLQAKTTRDMMLKRFVADELVAAHPYDPQAAFGRRLFVFAEEIEPLLIEYAGHSDSFTRRNAVAALGRYTTRTAMSALAEIAASTDDQVVLMRALAALGDYRFVSDPAPLLERLKKTSDGIEEVALVEAAGHLGMAGAMPTLLKLGAKGRDDSDLLVAVLTAMARIPPIPDSQATTQFLNSVEHSARTAPDRFQVHFPPAPVADVPDKKTTRGEVLAQLAQLALARLGDEEATQRVLALLPKDPAKPDAARERLHGQLTNDSLLNVHPPVLLVFLENLRFLGAPGVAGLNRVARDVTVEPALRGYALSQLPFGERGPLAASMAEKRSGDDETRIYAFEILAADGHSRLPEIGRKLLQECRRAAGGTGTAEQRYIWSSALRALGQRRLLRAEDVLPLLNHVKDPKIYRDAIAKARRRVERLVERLVEDAAVGMNTEAMRLRIEEILQLVIDHRVSLKVSDANRMEMLEQVGRQLSALKGHRFDWRYKTLVGNEINKALGLAFFWPMSIEDTTYAVVLLEEQILFAVGRLRSDEAADVLVAFLAGQPESPYRAHAALALGMTGRADAARHLVPLLIDEDGFTRFCAYESLRRLTGQDFPADWMFGDIPERSAAAERYFAWCATKR